MGGFWSGLGQGIMQQYGGQQNQNQANAGSQPNPMMRRPLPAAILSGVQAYRAQQKAKADQVGAPNMPTMPNAPNQYPGAPSDEDQGDGSAAMQAPQYDSMQSDENPEPLAAGKMVTTPTTAILAEHGQPEMVLPMNSDPHNKTSGASLLDQPGNTLGAGSMSGGIRTRYRHPTGPVASGKMKPISADLPLRPNMALR
jgi:hypothetical protein